MAELLISVRDAAEARIAVAGGASLVDVKEPSLGSLGQADEGVLVSVLDAVAQQRPVSAAMGELREWTGEHVAHLDRLMFVKWGLSGAPPDWRERLVHLRDRVESASRCRVVVAAYADHRRADAPTPREVLHFAVHEGFAALLVDTWGKDGTTLVDWMSVADATEIVAACRAAGLHIALAGGLGRRQIETLLSARPDWFAVRGAVCRDGARSDDLDATRVQALAALIAEGSPPRPGVATDARGPGEVDRRALRERLPPMRSPAGP